MGRNNKIGPEGATAIAKALEVNRVLTTLNLSGPFQNIGDQGAAAIAEALKVNRVLTKLNLAANDIMDEGATALASALEVNAVLTSLDVGFNQLTEEAALSIVRVEQQRDKLTSLGLLSCNIGTIGAKEIAEWISVSRMLTKLSLQYNDLNDESQQLLRHA